MSKIYESFNDIIMSINVCDLCKTKVVEKYVMMLKFVPNL